MLGVIKIDEKKVLKPINEMLADPGQVDIQELFELLSMNLTRSKRICMIPYTLIFCKKDKKILLIVLASLFSL